MKKIIREIAEDKINGPFALFMKTAMFFLSLFYFLIIIIINFLYEKGILKAYDLGKPVISVGNISFGGVGKTPIVIYLARYLREKGLNPAILIRGYMSGDKNSFSDEAAMLENELPGSPILVGKNRIKNAIEFMKKHHVDIFILDDGFQHRKIKRQLDVVAINACDSFGNGNLIPRGVLREPLSSLKRADIFILTKTDICKNSISLLEENLNKLNKNIPIIETIHYPEKFVDIKTKEKFNIFSLRGKEIFCFSSIGDAESFHKTLFNLGIIIKDKFMFIDHHVYKESDVEKIVKNCISKNINILVTTEKDFVKMEKFINVFNDLRLLYLQIEIKVTEKEDFLRERINSILHN